ncbi:MAG: hypothetical protein PHQ74_00575 [Crocinitomicaceae bacterium]|nr:hypothetical protein [Crocinitomicaceae bacterium]
MRLLNRIPVNADADDLMSNLDFAEAVVGKYKKDFQINTHSNKIGKKNPEYTYLKTTGDRAQWDKAYDARKFIQNGISDKLGKGKQLRNFDKSFIGFDFLGKLKQTDAIGVLAKLKGSFKVNESLRFVILKTTKIQL